MMGFLPVELASRALMTISPLFGTLKSEEYLTTVLNMFHIVPRSRIIHLHFPMIRGTRHVLFQMSSIDTTVYILIQGIQQIVRGEICIFEKQIVNDFFNK